MNNIKINPKSGEVWLVELPNSTGHQQNGKRPALIVSNNIGNHYSPIVECIVFTSQKKKNIPTHAYFKKGEANLSEDSVLLAEQKYSINKYQLIKKIGVLNDDQLIKASIAMVLSTPLVVKAFEAGLQETEIFQKCSA